MPSRSERTPLGAASSRRDVLRALAAAASTLTMGGSLGGCASALLAQSPRYDAAELSTNPTLLVATTRKAVNGARARPWYGSERAKLSVGRARMTPPSEGRFSLGSVGLSDWQLEGIELAPQIGDTFGPPGAPRDVLAYVHGFNTSFEAAVLDAARMADGIRFRGETLAFSWPSRAKLSEYSYDRESAMWSRDALEQVFAGLMASPTTGRIHLVAHSIGTMLAMESLRQIYARQGAAAADRIGAVVFASPDIDLDGFTSSVERIGPLAAKIVVVTATNDRALAMSGFLAGGTTRVGAAEKAELTRLGLHVIDASQQGWGIINHDLFLSNDKVRQVIRRAIDGRPTDGA
ncbi:MAG TPA: alpha/beta fold hydrolase [Xanthobacteraceae bacterium]|nr:alpha/beta fold hydrolase [Xanthobacteraceae bacterium]